MTEEAVRIEGFHHLVSGKICYYRRPDGVWMIYFPKVGLGDLSNHEIVEHEDGTISVAPSILTTRHDGSSVHGYLELGIWRDC